MLFFIFSNVDVQFANKKLTWRTYTTKKALPAIQWVELIDKNNLAKATLDENVKVFVVYMVFLISKMIIYLAWKA